MKTKFNESTSQRPQGDRMIDAEQVTIDLPLFMKQIREESAWRDGKRNAITVFKTNGLRIVLIALRENAEMARHTADGIISVQVLEGQLKFSTDAQSVILTKGQMIALHEKVPHSVLALEETVFLLSVSARSTATAAENRSSL